MCYTELLSQLLVQIHIGITNIKIIFFVTYGNLSFEHKRENSEVHIDQTAGSGAQGDNTVTATCRYSSR
jgi:hypothetical protein